VPGGRVSNPQSYHSAFRISSTRHEEASGAENFHHDHFPGNQKIIDLTQRDQCEKTRGMKGYLEWFASKPKGQQILKAARSDVAKGRRLLVSRIRLLVRRSIEGKNNLWMFLLNPVSVSPRVRGQKSKRRNGCSTDKHFGEYGLRSA
jgi:hypothetical protein